MESASLTPPAPITGDGSKPFDKGLKTGAIGYVSNVVIAVASTAPAYSMAATLGFVILVSGMGLQAPAIILIAFVPMLFISMGYKYLNQADPDCGTTFTWATRAFGPQAGWMGGWGIITSDVLVMASLAQIAALYTFHLWYAQPEPELVRGARDRRRLDRRDDLDLLDRDRALRAAAADPADDRGDHADRVRDRRAGRRLQQSGDRGRDQADGFAWFNPFDISSVSTLGTGVLVGIFIYWGWDSGVSVNEESENATHGPGKAAVLSTVLLVLIYLMVTTASQAYAGPTALGTTRVTSSRSSGRRSSPSRSACC